MASDPFAGKQRQPPLPMTVITGYLGAGKTTLINHLLANAGGRQITVLVNDFGEISLDEALIENRNGDIIALANGCMCCQIGGDLYRTIDLILGMRERIDQLVVETSGVADPSKIAQIASAEPELSNHGTLVLVDALNFPALLGDMSLRDTLERQLVRSDLVMLTKLDITPAGQIADVILGVAQFARDRPVIQTLQQASAHILSDDGFKDGETGSARATALTPHGVPFESWTWQGTEKINMDALLALLRQGELGVYRCKGIVHFDDGTSGVVNMVGERIEMTPVGNERDLSVLTVIGSRPGFSRAVFECRWNQCLPALVQRDARARALEGEAHGR